MEEKMLLLPVGLEVEGQLVKEAPLALTAGEAEEVFSTKPGDTKLYTWFGEVLAVAIKSLGSRPVNAPFLKSFDTTRAVPKIVEQITLNDVGTLLLQIQRECWQDLIPNQQISCARCPTVFTADVDLNKIEVVVDAKAYPHIYVMLSKTYVISNPNNELLADYEGVRFNCLKLRPPVLGDAIRHERISADETVFWRAIGFDCLEELVLAVDEPHEETGEVFTSYEPVAEGYIARKGKLFLTRELGSKDLKGMRMGLLTRLPSAKFYYEDTCGCGKYQVPFFAAQNNFFQ